MTEDLDYISNNTRFIKSFEKPIQALFVRNIVFLNSDILRENMKALLIEKGINTIRLTNDYKLNNLDFLKNYDLPFIRSIDILSDSVTDVEGVYSLKGLESINSINLNIDYTKLPRLRSLSAELSMFSYKNLSTLNGLESISIIDKFKEDDLTIFTNNRKLKYLMIRGSKIKSLKGLENFKELECLELFHNRRLESLEGITKEHTKLKKIAVYTAPKLFYVNKYLTGLPWLEYLQLEAKNVDSYRFLDNLTNLDILGIHNKINNVADGDKSPLIEALKRTNSKIW
jgi:hypothetical protein